MVNTMEAPQGHDGAQEKIELSEHMKETIQFDFSRDITKPWGSVSSDILELKNILEGTNSVYSADDTKVITEKATKLYDSIAEYFVSIERSFGSYPHIKEVLERRDESSDPNKAKVFGGIVGLLKQGDVLNAEGKSTLVQILQRYSVYLEQLRAAAQEDFPGVLED